MAHKAIEEAVEALLEPILDADGIELVDVEYVRERLISRQGTICGGETILTWGTCDEPLPYSLFPM